MAISEVIGLQPFNFRSFPVSVYRKSCNVLLEMGADINSPDIVGWTPLLWAAKAGNVGVTELLLERGVLIDHVDIDGNTALHVAAHFGQIETTRILLDYGANLLLQNKRELTCLDIAMEAQNNEVVMVIVKHSRSVLVALITDILHLVFVLRICLINFCVARLDHRVGPDKKNYLNKLQIRFMALMSEKNFFESLRVGFLSEV